MQGTGHSLKIWKKDPEKLFQIMQSVIESLAELHHSGKIHGAIGPNTIVLEEQYCFCFPLSEDFMHKYRRKVELLLKNIDQNGDSLFMRERGYIPLEQQMIDKKNSPASDVYSLCAVIYWLLTGQEPIDVYQRMNGEELATPSQMGITISAEKEIVIMKGLALLEKDRYANGIELYHALYSGEKKEQVGSLRAGWKIVQDIKNADKITQIFFLDHIPCFVEEHWDISQKGDRSVIAWMTNVRDELNLYIGGKGGVEAPNDCSGLFKNCINLKRIYFNDCFYTFNVTNMESMFANCTKLEELDFRTLDTSQVINMRWMFRKCANLKKINMKGFNTSKVIDMGGMFNGCRNLTELIEVDFRMSQVRNINGILKTTKFEEEGVKILQNNPLLTNKRTEI